MDSTQLAGHMKCLSETQAEVKQLQQQLNNRLQSIQHKEQQEIENIEAHISQCIHSLQKHQVDLIDQLRGFNAANITQISQSLQLLEDLSRQIQTQMDSVKTVVENVDVQQFSNAFKKKLALELKEDFKNQCLNLIYKPFHATLVTEKLVPHILITLVDKAPSVQVQEPICVNYSVLSWSYLRQVYEQHASSLQKMCLFGEHIWATHGCHAVHVYSKDCRFLNRYEHVNMRSPHGITPTPLGHVVVASGTGLHCIKESGEFLHWLGKQEYADVCYYGDKLYALPCNRPEMEVFHWLGRWILDHTVALECTVYTDDRLYVGKWGVVVSSVSNDCIYKYHYQQPTKLGHYGMTLGEFQTPFLCGVDAENKCLVADEHNQRLQVECADGWHCVTHQGELQCPKHAVIDGEYVWICDQTMLRKFIAVQL